LSECIIIIGGGTSGTSGTDTTASWLRICDVLTVIVHVIARAFSRSLVLFNSLKQCFFKRARLDD
jgi:hypothetical protein